MKLAIATLALLAGCTDEQNVGNTSLATPVFAAPRWAITLGATGDDIAYGVAVDPAGDVIAGGFFEGTVDFGNDVLVAPPSGASFLSKRAGADGSDAWTLALGTEASASANILDLATGADGSILVTGAYNGDLHVEQQILHGPPLQVSTDSFLAKYDPAGHLVWVTSLGADSSSGNTQLAVGADGRIALIGMYEGTLHLPSGAVTAASTDGDMFLVAFNSDGQLQWGVTAPNVPVGKGLSAAAVAMTEEDDVIVFGELVGSAVLEGTTLQASTSSNEYAARFTVDGTMLWVQPIVASGYTSPGPIGIAPDGGLVLTSTNKVSLLEHDNGLPGITALDPNGRAMWSEQAATGSAITRGATVLAEGTVVTSGTTSGYSIDFGSGALHGCMFLAAHDGVGNPLDAVTYGDPQTSCLPYKVASSATGAIAFVGDVDGAVDFGTGTLRYAGGHDAMIVMVDTTAP